MIRDHISDGAKHVVDALAAFITVGTLIEMLPHIAAILTIVWTGIRICETETVRGWFRRKPVE